MKKIFLISRSWKNKKIKLLIEEIHKELVKIIILVNFEEELDNSTENLLKKCKNEILKKIEIVYVKPWGDASGALNIGLNKVFTNKDEPDYILIASPEVDLKKDDVEKMCNILSNNPNMLVVGFALRTDIDENLEIWERGHSFDRLKSNALRIPWNTCAMWNANLFFNNVKAFLNICDYPEILGKQSGIELQGMEDALAIAIAKKNNPKLEVGLIKTYLKWNIDKKNISNHKVKMKRKSLVYKRYENIFDGFPSLDVKYF